MNDIARTITLAKTVALLREAAAVIVYDSEVLPVDVRDLTGDEGHEFLDLSYFDPSAKCDIPLRFSEGDNPNPTLSGSNLFLVCQDDEEDVQVTLLAPMVIPE